MDTKLKRYNVWLKVFSLVVFIVAATVAVTVIADIKKTCDAAGYSFYEYQDGNYYNTDYYNNQNSSARNYISHLHLYYTDTEYALSQVANESNEEIMDLFNQETNYHYVDEVYCYSDFNNFQCETVEAENAMKDFQATNSAEINEIAKNNIERHQIALSNDIYNNFSGGLVYFFTTPDGYVVTNTSLATVEAFETAYSTLSNGDANLSYTAGYDYQFAFTEDYLTSEFIAPYEAFAESINPNAPELMIVSIILMVPSLCYLVYTAGRKNSNQVDMLKIDKIYVDLNLILFASMAFTLIASIILIDDGTIYRLSPLVFCIEIVIILALFLSLVRHFKNKTIFKHVFIRKVVCGIQKSTKFNAQNSSRTPIVAIIAFGSLVTVLYFVFIIAQSFYGFVILSFGLLFIFPLAAYLLHKHNKEFEKLSEGAKKIKSGKYDEKIEVNFTKEYREFADHLNDISSGLSDEVERRLKSERMKTDLITNVSHDLKTPLTSFITYVDLLKKENIEDEKIQGYIEVLDQKSARLKVLVDDLVDSAKASSGTVQVSLDKVDVNAIISQSLGELNDVISQSNLNFRLKQPNEKLYIFADGKLLSRVIHNLIDNILKYSLPNTRVYINILEQNHNVLLEFKNISADELNISEDELMDRFVRGDKSRNTKGSGLGLNIAKSLVIAQNGELSISIDGDAFTAVVKMKKYNE